MEPTYQAKILSPFHLLHIIISASICGSVPFSGVGFLLFTYLRGPGHTGLAKFFALTRALVSPPWRLHTTLLTHVS